jgi:hypothetical protein
MNTLPTMDTVIKMHLQSALEQLEWNKSAVALALDLDRRTVYRMIQRYKLAPLAPELDEGLLLRCHECGAVSEPGEIDPVLMHTHTCPFREAVAQ